MKNCDYHNLPTDKVIKRAIKREEEKTKKRIQEKFKELSKKNLNRKNGNKITVPLLKLTKTMKFNPFRLIFVKTTFLAWKKFSGQKFDHKPENDETDILSVN